MEQTIIKSTKSLISDLLNLAKAGSPQLVVDYDKEADVLYVNFGKPKKADDAYESEDGIIQRIKNGKIIGLTVIDASQLSK